MTKYDELKTLAGQMSDRVAELDVAIHNLAVTTGDVAELVGQKGGRAVSTNKANVHRYFILQHASGEHFGRLNVTTQMVDALLPVLMAERDQTDIELAAIRAKLDAVEELLS